jgi:hypothetical protein
VGFAFISYSSADRSYVELLVTELGRRRLDFWYDLRIDPGNRWSRTIETNIRDCTVFVPVVTPRFVAWTLTGDAWCRGRIRSRRRSRRGLVKVRSAGERPG